MTTKIPVELSSTPGISDSSNATAITIDSSERIGIGTGSPSYKLTINTPDEDHLRFENGSEIGIIRLTDAGILDLWAHGSDEITFTNGTGAGTERMRIAADGFVGIGTPTANKLFNLADPAEGGETLKLHFEAESSADKWAIYSYDRTNGHYADLSFGGNYLYLKSGGNVGIGTTSPSDRFQVNHTGVQASSIRSSATNNDAYFAVGNSDMSDFIVLFGGHSANPSSTIGWDDSNNLRFATYQNHTGTFGTERMRINSSGTLLVGATAAPEGTPSVFAFATSSNSAFATQNTTTGATNYAMLFYANNTNINGSINVTNTATQFNTSSDYRLKENITPIENGLERLNKLNPVKFDWKDDGTSSEGFIAHEAQAVFPDAVTGEKDGEDIQGMDYGRITPLLVKAIQEQQEQIEQLKTEIQTLKGE